MLLIFLLKFCCQNCRVNQVYFRLFGNFTLQTYHITPVRSLIVKESRSWTCKETTKAQCTGFVFYQIVFLACFKENTYYSVIKMFHFALDLPMLFLQDLMSVLFCSYKKCRNFKAKFVRLCGFRLEDPFNCCHLQTLQFAWAGFQIPKC